MKNQIKYLVLLLGIGLSFGFIVSAAPTQTFQKDIFPISTNQYVLGTSTLQWLGISVKNASSTNLSILSTGYFNLNATGTMQGYSICTAGNAACGTGGTGLSSLNGLTGATQTFATSTSGTNFNISSSGTTHTFNIPYSSSANTGLLTFGDWTTFNNKADYSFGANNFSGTGSFTGGNATTTGLTVQGGTKLGSLDILALNTAGVITNANLANSTISGVALGGTLANLTATDSTLTFSGTYTGALARTIGLNLGQANSWTGAQTFINATSSALSVTGGAQFASLTMSATSTMNGYSLCTSGNGICAGSLTGTTGQLAYFSGTNTAVGTSTMVIGTNGIPTIGTGSEVMRITGGFLGVGTTSPISLLTVSGDIATGGDKPTLTSCGTTPTIRGSDSAGEVTVGSVAATGCTITFAAVKTNAPTCTITNQSSSTVNAMTYTISTTALTVSQTGLTGAKINYNCIQMAQ